MFEGVKYRTREDKWSACHRKWKCRVEGPTNFTGFKKHCRVEANEANLSRSVTVACNQRRGSTSSGDGDEDAPTAWPRSKSWTGIFLSYAEQ